jgi:Bacterial transcriptional regulator
MTVLRNRTGETVQVAVLDGREMVYIERLDSPHTVRLFLKVGRRNWAHCTSTGKMLLAHLPVDRLNRVPRGWELPAVTPHAITDHELLRKALAEIRDLGHAENQSESEVGVASVAALIRDGSGHVIAALSDAGPTTTMDPELQTLRYAVMEVAAAASRRLGHGSGTGGREAAAMTTHREWADALFDGPDRSADGHRPDLTVDDAYRIQERRVGGHRRRGRHPRPPCDRGRLVGAPACKSRPAAGDGHRGLGRRLDRRRPAWPRRRGHGGDRPTRHRRSGGAVTHEELLRCRSSTST